MNTRLNSLFAFVAGAAIGAVVTYKVVSDKYEQIIDAMTEGFDEDFVEGSEDEPEEEDEVVETNALDEMRTAYNNITQNSGYTEGYVDEKEDDGMPNPYVIAPKEVGDLDGYNTDSLNYYADGVLTDQFDNIIDSPEELIGNIKPEAHFGQYEEDAVYVRNDVTKCDYEILRDNRKYSDAYPEE